MLEFLIDTSFLTFTSICDNNKRKGKGKKKGKGRGIRKRGEETRMCCPTNNFQVSLVYPSKFFTIRKIRKRKKDMEREERRKRREREEEKEGKEREKEK